MLLKAECCASEPNDTTVQTKPILTRHASSQLTYVASFLRGLLGHCIAAIGHIKIDPI